MQISKLESVFFKHMKIIKKKISYSQKKPGENTSEEPENEKRGVK